MTRFGAVVCGVVVAVSASCKGAEPDFVESYLTSFCAFFIDCTDPAVAAFDGLPTVEDCRAEFGPPLAARAEGCKLEKDAAELCLQELDGAACPEEGAPEDALPAVCAPDLVWKKCDGPTGAGDDEDASEG